jgi:hypothetical protein
MDEFLAVIFEDFSSPHTRMEKNEAKFDTTTGTFLVRQFLQGYLTILNPKQGQST